MQNLTSAITYSSPDGPTPDSLPPFPESVRSAFGRHNQIFLDGLITKFSKLLLRGTPFKLRGIILFFFYYFIIFFYFFFN